MSNDALAWVVVVNGLVQVTGLVAIIMLSIKGFRQHREIMRLNRGVAGLVYQESEKTRARLDELFGQTSR